MSKDQSSSYLSLPDNLPVPEDDGAADHLVGKKMPQVKLLSTKGEVIYLDKLSGRNVFFCYPMTGVPGVPLPPVFAETYPAAPPPEPPLCPLLSDTVPEAPPALPPPTAV